MNAVHTAVDPEVNSAYVTISNNPIASTIEVSPWVLVDLDDSGAPVGVEVLDLGTRIPVAHLEDRFGIGREVFVCHPDLRA